MTAKDRMRKLKEGLDTAAEAAMSPNIVYGDEPGYVEENVEERAQDAADEEGVTLYRNPDGSHEAVDESKSPWRSVDEDDSEGQ